MSQITQGFYLCKRRAGSLQMFFRLRKHRNNTLLPLPKSVLMSHLLLQPLGVASGLRLSAPSCRTNPQAKRTAQLRRLQRLKPSLYGVGVSKSGSVSSTLALGSVSQCMTGTEGTILSALPDPSHKQNLTSFHKTAQGTLCYLEH